MLQHKSLEARMRTPEMLHKREFSTETSVSQSILGFNVDLIFFNNQRTNEKDLLDLYWY